MPRASSAAKDAYQGGRGLQEGNVKVENTVFKITEFTNSNGDVVLTPFVTHLDYFHVDDNLQPHSDEVQSRDIVIASFPDDSGEYMHRPGNADGPEDEDPEDLGSEVGTEGNSIFCDPPRAIRADSDWMKFTQSLEKLGFPVEVNAQSYAPNYNGLIVHVHSEPGREYTDKKTGEKKTLPSHWVADKIWVNPHAKGQGAKKGATAKGAAASKGAGKKAGGSKSSAKSKPATKAAGGKPNGGVAASGSEEMLGLALSSLAQTHSGTEFTLLEFQTEVTRVLKEDHGKKLMEYTPLLAKMRDADWMMAQAGEYGFGVDMDEGQVVLP